MTVVMWVWSLPLYHPESVVVGDGCHPRTAHSTPRYSRGALPQLVHLPAGFHWLLVAREIVYNVSPSQQAQCSTVYVNWSVLLKEFLSPNPLSLSLSLSSTYLPNGIEDNPMAFGVVWGTKLLIYFTAFAYFIPGQ